MAMSLWPRLFGPPCTYVIVYKLLETLMVGLGISSVVNSSLLWLSVYAIALQYVTELVQPTLIFAVLSMST